MPDPCTHLGDVRDVSPRTPKGCEECLATGAHNRKTRHPLIRSFEPGEDWGWCYVDELMLEPAPRAR